MKLYNNYIGYWKEGVCVCVCVWVGGGGGGSLLPLTNLYPSSPNMSTGKVFVYKIQVNPIHTILKYGDYYDFMDR